MKMLIGGKWCDASNGATMDNLNPATGEVYDTVPRATKEDVERAVELAVEGQKEWVAMPLYKRMEAMEEFIRLVEENAEEIAKIMTIEGGKPMAQSRAEVGRVKDTTRAYMAAARTLFGKTMPVNPEPRGVGDINFTMYEPLGVVVCVTAFNFPAVVFAHKVAAALCAGNSVILKPASDTPCSALYMINLFHKAGIPGNTIQCVTGGGAEVGNWLVKDSRVAAVTLTGSTAVGLNIAEECSKQLKPYCLELGGNDPFVIFDDVDVDEAVKETLAGRIGNAGQICCSSKRFIVQNTIKEEYTKKLVAAITALKVGDPQDESVDVGPVINKRAADNIMKHIEIAKEQGAKVACGGTQKDCFIMPTVLADVPKEADIAQSDEIFGPVFPVIGFDTLEEAIEIANNTEYGLSSGILTKDFKRAMKFALTVDAGACVVGGNGNYRLGQQPFGGHKMSGVGTEGAMYTLTELSKIKTIVLKNVL